jgi:hypothetical protein
MNPAVGDTDYLSLLSLAVKGAASAMFRIGGVFGLYTAVRCGVERQLAMPISAPFIAGAVAVSVPTLLDSKRQDFLSAYFKEHAGQAFKRSSVIGASAVSGAVLFGCVDSYLRYMEWNW